MLKYRLSGSCYSSPIAPWGCTSKTVSPTIFQYEVYGLFQTLEGFILGRALIIFFRYFRIIGNVPFFVPFDSRRELEINRSSPRWIVCN